MSDAYDNNNDISDLKDSNKNVKRKKSNSVSTSSSSSASKKTKVTALCQTDATPLDKLFPNGEESTSGYKYKIITWNVAGLRALIKNHPMALSNLATEHDADVICLQETKLQPDHVYDDKLKIQDILKEEGYKSYFSCCSVKKGYSGTAVFIKQYNHDEHDVTNIKQKKSKQMTLNFGSKNDSIKTSSSTVLKKKHPLLNHSEFIQQNLIPKRISFSMNHIHHHDHMDKNDEDDHDPEGRIICVELPNFFFVNLYVPNSGQKLERLDYRIHTWDKTLSKYMYECMLKWKKPGIWLGDLNVAHLEKDVWNYGAKHLLKQAGCTLEERASFDELLRGYKTNETEEEKEEDEGSHHQSDNPVFRDVFRTLHPNASGHYSYWSQRAGNRLPNKGLRLDYFVAHNSMFSNHGSSHEKKKEEDASRVLVRDSYMLPNVQGSDHCPCVLELELRDVP